MIAFPRSITPPPSAPPLGPGGGWGSYYSNRSIVPIIICFIVSLLTVSSASALDVPHLTGYINDYAGMIPQPVQAELSRTLAAFEASESTQIVIVTIPSLQGEVAEEFSIKIAEQWKIGQKGKDNGIIFFVSKDEHKIRIEVGRGLEGRLTDLMTGRIIDQIIKPKFRAGDFGGGFSAGTAALIAATRGEFKAAPDGPGRSSRRSGGLPQLVTFIVFGAIALLVLSGFSRMLAGAAGAVGLPAMVALLLTPIGLLTAVLLAVAGLLIGLFLPSLFSSGGRGGGIWPGGGYYGGGFGGGGMGDGGFSGGGGDFGGGGASGDW